MICTPAQMEYFKEGSGFLNHICPKTNRHRDGINPRRGANKRSATPWMHCTPLWGLEVALWCAYLRYAIGMPVSRLSQSICAFPMKLWPNSFWLQRDGRMGERENRGMGEWGSPLVRTNKWRLQWTSAKAKAFHVGNRQINKRENNTRRQANGQTNETRHDESRYTK